MQQSSVSTLATLGLAAVLGLAPCALPAVDVDSGVVAEWTFDTGFSDSSGNGYHGSNQGAVLTTDARVGAGAARFDGINDRVVLSPDLPDTLFTQITTISLWLRDDGSTGNGEVAIARYQKDDEFQFVGGISQGGIGSFPNGSFVYAFATDPKGDNKKKNILVHTLDSGSVRVDDGAWHHVAVTVEPLVRAVLYIDGVQVDEVPIPDPIWVPPGTLNTTIGAINNMGENPYGGHLDHVRVYNRAISESEVAVLGHGPYLNDLQLMAKDHREIDLHLVPAGELPDSWIIERSTTAAFTSIDASFTLAGSTSFYRDLTCAPNTTYHYRARALSDGVEATPEQATSDTTTAVRTVPVTIGTSPQNLTLFSQYAYEWLSPFGQDRSTSIAPTANGVTITGNAWKQLQVGTYTLQPTTVLEVTAHYTDLPEFAAIALGDHDDFFEYNRRAFQLAGTERFAYSRYYDLSAADGDQVTYRIPIGLHQHGTIDRIALIHDADADAGASTTFSAIRLYEDPTIGMPITHNGASKTLPISPFAPQDGPITYRLNVQLHPEGIELQGNSWKKAALDTTIQPDTVLEFDISSTGVQEIHGVGFCNGDTTDGHILFQIDGSQPWGNRNFRQPISTSAVRIRIPVGQYYTGTFTHLLIACDNDLNRDAFSQTLIRNLSIYNSGAVTAPILVDDGASEPTLINAPITAFTPQHHREGSAVAVVGGVSITGNTWQKAQIPPYTITPNTTLSFTISSTSPAELHNVGLVLGDTFDQHFMYQIDGSETWGRQEHRISLSATPVDVVIPLSHYYLTGKTYPYILLVNDDDRVPSFANTTITNIRIGEGLPPVNN